MPLDHLKKFKNRVLPKAQGAGAKKVAGTGTRRKRHKWYPTPKKMQYNRLYCSKQWKDRRKEQLVKHPVCQMCHNKLAREVDHVVPHHGREKAFHTGRLASVCRSCHMKKSGKGL